MKSRIGCIYFIAVFVPGALLSAAVRAHHSPPAFDVDTTMTLEGEVVRVPWRNPHIYFDIEVEDENGNVETWDVEGGWPHSLIKLGWSRDTVQVGDRVTVTGLPARNPERHSLVGMTLQMGGQVLSMNAPPGTPIQDQAFTEQDRTGIAVPEALEGTWAPLSTDEMALLRPEVLPPEAGPQFTEPVLAAIEKGLSVGHWDGDALVVSTTFDTTMTGRRRLENAVPVPMGGATRVVERFQLSDDCRQPAYSWRIENPDYLVEPYTRTTSWAWRPDIEVPRMECDPSVAGRFQDAYCQVTAPERQPRHSVIRPALTRPPALRCRHKTAYMSYRPMMKQSLMRSPILPSRGLRSAMMPSSGFRSQGRRDKTRCCNGKDGSTCRTARPPPLISSSRRSVSARYRSFADAAPRSLSC